MSKEEEEFDVEDMFKDFDEMEKALDSIWHCYEQVWQMYENGREPTLEINEYPYKEEVYDSFKKQLGISNA